MTLFAIVFNTPILSCETDLNNSDKTVVGLQCVFECISLFFVILSLAESHFSHAADN